MRPLFARSPIGLCALGSCALCLASCRPALTEQECLKLLDHYTDKQIDQARPSTLSAERFVLIEQARVRAASDPEFATCPAKVSRSDYECAMEAGSADAIERCLL